MNRSFRFAALAVIWIGWAIPGPGRLARANRQNARHSGAKSRVSPFGRKPFTADLTIVGKQGTYHGKMYAGSNALRTDVRLSSGVTTSIIVRYDKRIEWILIPGRRYIVAPIETSGDLLSALRDKSARVEKQDLGRENVGAYACEKYRVKVSGKGRKESGWIWVARGQGMKGFIVKARDRKSGESVELSHIQLSAPNPSLFNLPAGYHQLRKPSKTRRPAH